jgi:hypothetical protein
VAQPLAALPKWGRDCLDGDLQPVGQTSRSWEPRLSLHASSPRGGWRELARRPRQQRVAPALIGPLWAIITATAALAVCQYDNL